jgi:hypothetical protein
MKSSWKVLRLTSETKFNDTVKKFFLSKYFYVLKKLAWHEVEAITII